MKLIEILVKHLNRWPDGVGEIEMHDDGGLFFDGDRAYGYTLPKCTDGWRGGLGADFSNAVTKEQYEAALAASKEMLVNKPVAWDGQGLPPMDMECEAVFSDGSEVLVGKAAYIGEHIIFITRKTNNQHHPEVESVLRTGNWSFRPHINEAGRKREEIIDALHKSLPDITYTDCIDVYNLILSGDIPGVKLEAPDED